MTSRPYTPSEEETPILSWGRLGAFAKLVEELDLYGLHFQHVALCERRAWFHLKRIDCAHLDERMALGTVLHALSRARDRSVEGLSGLNPDRIDWTERIVFEAKGGAGAVDAVSDQTALYAVILTAATGREWRAATHLIRLKNESGRSASIRIDSNGFGVRHYACRRWQRTRFLPLPNRLRFARPAPIGISVGADKMETLFVSRDAKLERRDSTIVVKTDGSVRRFPAETLRHLVLLGEAGLTSALLGLCGQSGIRVTVLDWHGNVAGSFDPFNAPQSGHVRLSQAAHVLDPSKRMVIAREIVAASIDNILANLRYRAWRGNDLLAGAIENVRALAARVPSCQSPEQLMGIEGSVRAAYYEAWPLIDGKLAFAPRRRRPPNNRINCLISWFNGLAYAATRHEIGKTHLEPAFSFLHAPATARYSLSLDLSEAFKPAVVDTLIFELVMRQRLDDAWFVETDGVCRLTEAGRRATLESWVTKIESPGASGASMRDRMRADALALERHVLGIAEFAAFRRKI